ncbi:hypothetical protein D3C78_1175630 [compost metagenome]
MPGTGAPRPVRVGQQIVRLGQPHGFSVHQRSEPGHQAVVEMAPGVQPIHSQPLDQLLALERQPLILQLAIVANGIGQLEQLGILQQAAQPGLGGVQPEQGHRLDELAEARLQLLAAGEQHLGRLVATVAAEPVVAVDLGVPGQPPHLIRLAPNGPQQMAQGIDVMGLWQLGQQGDQGRQELVGVLKIGVDGRAIGGGIDVIIQPSGCGHNSPYCLHPWQLAPSLWTNASQDSTKGAGACLAPIRVSKRDAR